MIILEMLQEYIVELLMTIAIAIIGVFVRKIEKLYKRSTDDKEQTSKMERERIASAIEINVVAMVEILVRAAVANFMGDADKCRDPVTKKISFEDAVRIKNKVKESVRSLLPSHQSGTSDISEDKIGVLIDNFIEQACLDYKRSIPDDSSSKVVGVRYYTQV